MKLTLFFDHRFVRGSDGVIFSPTTYNYDLLVKRYLSVFDEMTIVARVDDRPTAVRGEKHAEGAGIRISPVGNWQGPLQYMRHQRLVRSQVQREVENAEAVLMIAPGRIGQIAADHLRSGGRPYGLEVVGDPMDVFAAGATRHALRPLLQRWATRELREQASSASSVAYVSKMNLPQRYPPGPNALTTYYSSIDLRNEHFVDQVKPRNVLDREIRLVTIGTLSQIYKGIDVLIDAVFLLEKGGANVTLTILGDGRFRTDLEDRANAHGVAERVHFCGHLAAGDPVREELDKADMFVLASRTEGLPRAMIEAMARGLPCIGTSVGGIPELLPANDMVEAGSAQALATKIREVASDPERMEAMAVRNLETARSYHADILGERRQAMYSYVKERTQEWMTKDKR
jgi:glycosyltransferase involved in cell wall biosynthesis